METSSGKGSGMDPVANTTSFDVVIIGAGIVGAAAFRELCKYDLKVLLLDSLHDVGGDASRANSAILHGGFDPQPGTLMSIFNKQGVQLWFQWAQELSIDVEWTGSLVLAFNDADIAEITRLYHNGKKVRVPVKFLGRDENVKKRTCG